ncbi:MAG TPA: hypothetical protein VHQ43_03515 [Solirubrobacterales bacterium]|jgi:hypothetical protein|nr:hypothetical protein [Solirubrobacterales bacterium]
MRQTGPPPLPRIFLAVAKPRRLWMLLALTLASGAAMLPAMATMADHGASLFDFESAGSVTRSQEILATWGSSGERAMWWQLALDLPFLAGYGLFLAGACTAVALRAQRGGRSRLARGAAIVAWFGPLAAAADFLQNVALALVLAGWESQPWPRISALCGPVTTSLAAGAAAFALLGALATRRRASAAVEASSATELGHGGAPTSGPQSSPCQTSPR